ncbi:hypothetical protein [Flavobacterium sp.]|uniref:hypothetical protein n=1 Tax=Flavobacterium sp. TaxID=239 RepID=UPI002B4B6764|nr:hypothetical protein [Flavobacterium sp.]HLP64265.1 hypothetical protein [Flavobacterium sp.]
MKSKVLEKELFEEFEKYSEITSGLFVYRNSKEFKSSDTSHMNYFNDEKHKEIILEEIRLNIKLLFSELYQTSKQENYYWGFCSARVFINTFNDRSEEFLNNYDDVDKSISDFLGLNLNSIKSNSNSNLLDLIHPELKRIILNQEKEKTKFLNEKVSLKPDYLITKNETHVFICEKAQELFMRYYDEYIASTKNKLVEVSFIYRKMYDMKLIHQHIKPENFKTYISEYPLHLEINSSLKTYNLSKSPLRETNFNSLFELTFKKK